MKRRMPENPPVAARECAVGPRVSEMLTIVETGR